MATYFVGDIQGCFEDLQRLLNLAEFAPKRDQLWLTGDLVARGPQSLETLEFVKDLGTSAQVVLGNHDLHLLAVAEGISKLKKRDNLESIIESPNASKLLAWLRHQPLLACHPEFDVVMVHAGISPQWRIKQAKGLAQEAQAWLHDDSRYRELLTHMYGNQPDRWSDDLQGLDRCRYIINSFTRMRYCFADGALEFAHKTSPSQNTDAQLMPWFEVPGRHLESTTVIFGHWASLMGESSHPKAIGLDTGCVWGNSMTMLRWEDQALFSTPCPVYS
jgi:bis(5'-nucleosyl)-tetraphosphatase (symmetrical)